MDSKKIKMYLIKEFNEDFKRTFIIDFATVCGTNKYVAVLFIQVGSVSQFIVPYRFRNAMMTIIIWKKSMKGRTGLVIPTKHRFKNDDMKHEKLLMPPIVTALLLPQPGQQQFYLVHTIVHSAAYKYIPPFVLVNANNAAICPLLWCCHCCLNMLLWHEGPYYKKGVHQMPILID